MQKRKISILWAFLVAVLASLLIFFKFNQIPAYTTWDEIEFARFAVNLTQHSYIPYDEYATGHATLYFYLILASFKLFGLSEFALRLPSAVFGVLATVSMYGVLNLLFKNGTLRVSIPGFKKSIDVPTAAILTLVFLTLRWFFGFARFSFEATFLLFLELTALYAVIMFTQKPKKLMWLIISALFTGLAYNSYQPGRFFAVIPLLTLFLNKDTRKVHFFAIFGGIFAVLIAPLTLHLSQYPDVRVKQQLYLADTGLDAREKLMFFLDNVWRNTKLFFIEGDASGRHNYPFKAALNPIIALISLTGLIQALRDMKNKWNLLFLVYFGIAMGPTLLTYPHENPNMLRTVTVLPALVYFAGLGIQWMKAYIEKIDKNQYIVPFIGTIIVGMLLASTTLELRTYFVFQRPIFEEAFEVRDRFGGVYFYMKENRIDINQFRIPEDQIEKYNSVPGPEMIYRNQ